VQNHEFMARAPKEIVQENRARHEELSERYRKLQSNLDFLPR
jgi:valyl-tRNA synthetase